MQTPPSAGTVPAQRKINTPVVVGVSVQLWESLQGRRNVVAFEVL